MSKKRKTFRRFKVSNMGYVSGHGSKCFVPMSSRKNPKRLGIC